MKEIFLCNRPGTSIWDHGEWFLVILKSVGYNLHRNSRFKITEVTLFIGFGFISKYIKSFMKSWNILLPEHITKKPSEYALSCDLLDIWAVISE